ncbi:MAG TPA: response regulator [Terriglobales bacterium]|nr:response regulator [Terriglobales bacterium]HXY13087.1 response regulator [Terriglobales bacterium]
MAAIRTLIVDDSPVMRKIIERCLRQAGMDLASVFEAANGEEALAVVKGNKVDLILCDINMPVVNGLEFIKLLRTEPGFETVPVIMITSESGEKHVLEALALGAKGYIRKPFTPDQVKMQIVPALRV